MTRSVIFLLLLVPLAGCGPSESEIREGYVEGEFITIAAPEAGWVDQVAVVEGDQVAPGTLLFTLESTREQAARDAAAANVKAAEARLTLAEQNLVRQEALARTVASARKDLDAARSERESAAAALDAARSELARAEWSLDQRRVLARTNARVEDVVRHKGDYVAAGGAVVLMLPPENLKLRFFVPEPMLAAMKPGMKVGVSCDGCPDGMTATVGFIAREAEFTAPFIFSVGNRERLVFLVEARPDGEAKALRPGLPIEVRLNP